MIRRYAGALCLWGAVAAAGTVAAVTPASETAAFPVSESAVQIDADFLRYAGHTGEMKATGAVEIRYGDHFITTPELVGNARTKIYRLPQTGHWENDAAGIDLAIVDARYDGKSKQASWRHVEGLYDAVYLRGEDAVYTPQDGGTVLRAMVTTPSAVARVPDYRMEADKVVILPDGRLKASNASFYIKNRRVFTLPGYRARVGNQHARRASFMSFLPRPIYRSHNGVGLRLTPSYPLTDRWDVFLRADWYARTGFKPDVGVRYIAPRWTATWHYGKEESIFNDDSIWLERRPEFKLATERLYFRNGWYAVAEVNWGRWYENQLRGNHFGWNLFFGVDPIHMTGKWTVTPYFGVRQDRYSVDQTVRNDRYYGVRADYASTSRWTWWVGTDDHHLSSPSPYRFDRWEIERAAYVGMKYRIDRLNAVGVECRWDTVNGTLHDMDYTWYRDMHSFAGKLTYRTKQGQISVDIWAKDF